MNTLQRHEQQTRKYRVLIGIAEEVVGNARAALAKTRKMRGGICSPTCPLKSCQQVEG